MPETPVRSFDVRHLQLARALFALVAAIMITFSPDHSANVGLAVFGGFAVATGLVFLLSVWLIFPADHRWPSVVLGILTFVAGMVGGLVGFRSTTLFFVLVIAWAFATGIAELAAGLVARRRARAAGDTSSDARDAIVVGAVTLVLALALLIVSPSYSLDYFIDDAGQWFTLTGISIAVGIFGGYAAIIGVYLAIAGFSPRRPDASAADPDAGATRAPIETGGVS